MWGKDSLTNPVLNVQPWASVIQQTLNHQNVPEYFQRDDTMKYSAEILEEEEVLQTTTCTPTRHLHGHQRDGQQHLKWSYSPFRHWMLSWTFERTLLIYEE